MLLVRRLPGRPMGRHAGPIGELTAPGPFSEVMIAGFLPNGSKMHFIEPMVTVAKFQQRQNFTLPVPMPQSLGQQTLYPSRFEAVFQGNAYHLVFSNFIDTSAMPAMQASASDSVATSAGELEHAFSEVLMVSEAPHSESVAIDGDDDGVESEESDDVLA